jgi:hypothetical protein
MLTKIWPAGKKKSLLWVLFVLSCVPHLEDLLVNYGSKEEDLLISHLFSAGSYHVCVSDWALYKAGQIRV